MSGEWLLTSNSFHLLSDNFLSGPSLPVLQLLADASDHLQTILQRKPHLLSHQLHTQGGRGGHIHRGAGFSKSTHVIRAPIVRLAPLFSLRIDIYHGEFFRTQLSSLEGATKLKFVSNCSF